MDEKQGMEILRSLAERYNVHLDMGDWEGREILGGIGMDESNLAPFQAFEKERGYTTATVYEMESTHLEFTPLDIPLNVEGLRTLRRELIGMFDLALVPHSRTWALVMSNELESIFYGPAELMKRIP
ncbi:MAG TPA: hypothetical protein VFT37_15540 [Telluria sp.]|nr:hypothetical protein [Telluria sp.]